MKVSSDGKVVDFGSSRIGPGAMLQFDLRSLALSSAPPNDGATFAPIREGLDDRRLAGRKRSPTLGGSGRFLSDRA